MSQRRTVHVVDLSHPVTAGMVTSPGLPGPLIAPDPTSGQARHRYAGGTDLRVDRLTLVGNTGTYLQCPYHRYPGGTDLGQQPLELLVDLPTVVVRSAATVDAAVLRGPDMGARAVLVHTGWDRHWSTPGYAAPDAPHLTTAAADLLAEAGALLVGIDAIDVDALADRTRPVHSALLAAGVPILENLTNLGALPDAGARLHAAPPALHGMGAMTVRAYALVPA